LTNQDFLYIIELLQSLLNTNLYFYFSIFYVYVLLAGGEGKGRHNSVSKNELRALVGEKTRDDGHQYGHQGESGIKKGAGP
jgi:hypothetical protein